MKKRKVKRYNGEEGSVTEEDRIGEIARKAEFDKPGGQRGPIPMPSDVPEMEKSKTFKEAFADARRSGDSTFMWKGKKYTTELAKPKAPMKEVKVESVEEVTDTSSKPAKTAKEKMAEIVSRTPLRNPQGGINVENMLRRNQEIGATGMKESARQARVDRIRRNVGSNLETYGMKSGGKVSKASSRADGIAQRGKTRGRIC